MNDILDICLVIILLTSVLIAGSNRLYGHIRLISLQGLLLSLVTVFAHWQEMSADTLTIATMNFVVMALLAPWLLRRAVREAEVQEETVPYLGYVASIVLCVLMVALSFALFAKVRFVHGGASFHLLPYAMSNVLVGLLMIVARKKAFTQVVGYLIMTNGISLFGIGLAAEQPLLVEMGILVDAFFAVLVMGIAIYHINREFDSIDASRLVALKDRL